MPNLVATPATNTWKGKIPMRNTRTFRGLMAIGVMIAALVAAVAPVHAQSRGVETYVTSSMTVTIKDMYGNVLVRHRYPASTQHQTISIRRLIRQARALEGHGTVGSPSKTGSATFSVHQTGRSTSGWPLWTVTIKTPNVYWGGGYIGVPGYGTTSADHQDYRQANRDWQTSSPGVSWNGWIDGASWYMNWNGNPQSGFHYMSQGSFTVPNALSGLNYEYPKNTLEDHANGTAEWWTSCCGN